MDKAFLDDEGYDIVSKELGMLQLGVSNGLGSWEGRNDPVSQNEIVVPRQYRVKEDGVISEDAKDLIAAYAAVKGILLKQDGIGWHRPFFKKSQKRADQNGIDVNIGRPFSLTETQAISTVLSQYGLEPISTATGVRFINFSDDSNTPYSGLNNYEKKKADLDFGKVINQALKDIQFDNDEAVTATRFVSDNDLIKNNWQENTNGEGYLENRLSGRPDLQGRVTDIVAQLQPRVREVESEFSERYGWTPNAGLNTAYDESGSQDQRGLDTPTATPGAGVLSQVDSAQLELPFGKPDVIPNMAKPTTGQVKVHMDKAQEILDVAIGLPGSKFEKGVSTQADIMQIAEILNVMPMVFDNRSDYQAASGKNSKDTSIGNFIDLGNSTGEAKVLAAGVKDVNGEPITNLEFLITMVHENIGHALESRNPNNFPGKVGFNRMSNLHPESGGSTVANNNSLRAEITQQLANALAAPNDFNKKTLEKAKKIRAEIEAIQDQTEVFFENAPELGTSFLRDSPIKWEKQFIDEMKADGRIGESTAKRLKVHRRIYEAHYKASPDYIKYKRNNAEFSVDPVILYVMNPTLMKKVAPETAKFIREHFNSSKIPVSFHANPIVTVLAIIMAGVAAMEDDEEEKNNPGALTPQPGALTA
jgi:hypothetical protein